MTALTILMSTIVPADQVRAAPVVVVVMGAEGTSEYGEQFRRWAANWHKAAQQGGARFQIVGSGKDDVTDHDELQSLLTRGAEEEWPELWLVFIGHGTFDGRTCRFNLRGPDVSAVELNKWLEPIRARIAVINCASSSAPFINHLSTQDRVIVTATKSGGEHNFTFFGKHLAEVIGDPIADLDKDDQTSLLEAWLLAARRTQENYDTQGRLATEHPLLDDNGDSRGSRADAFRGTRPIRQQHAGSLDGIHAHQLHLVPSDRERNMPLEIRKQRDQLEQVIASLREQKPQLTEDEYYEQLEPLLIDLAQLYAELDHPDRIREAYVAPQ